MNHLNLHLRQLTHTISLVLMHPMTHSPLFYEDWFFFLETTIITFLGPWTRSFFQMMLADCLVQIWRSELHAYSLLNAHCRDQGRSSTDNFNIFHCNLSSPPSVTIKISTGRKSAIISFFPVPKINYVPQQLLGTHRAVRQLQIRVRMQCEVQAGICPCLVFRNAQ